MDGKLRNMTALYLLNGEKVLLLYRVGSRVVGNSYTGTAGGHFEKEELNDSKACVLRELQEETGLTEGDIQGLALRYVCLRLKNGEIRQNYYFFARLRDPDRPIASNEGSLVWTDLKDIGDYRMPATARFMLEHYAREGRFTDLLYGGITTGQGIRFTPLEEFPD